jgi:hypothetical protein
MSRISEQHSSRSQRAGLRVVFAGLALCLLGLLNILYGSHKSNEYQIIMLDSANSSALPPNMLPESPINRVPSQNEGRHAEARRDYYVVVVYGGKVFSIIGLGIVLVGLRKQARLRKRVKT